MNKLTISQALIYMLCFSALIFLTRLFPFALFSKKEPPKFLQFAAQYMPSMVMVVLILYSLRSVSLTLSPFGIPHLCGIIVTVLLHLWKKNAMISIFGATIVYMIFISIL